MGRGKLRIYLGAAPGVGTAYAMLSEALLERVRETFGMEPVALLERESDVDPWTRAGRAGSRPCRGQRHPYGHSVGTEIPERPPAVDRGPGVPDEAKDKDRIFAPFQRYGTLQAGPSRPGGLAELAQPEKLAQPERQAS